MTKVIKKSFEDFKNVALTPKKTAKVKGGADSDPIILEEVVTG